MLAAPVENGTSRAPSRAESDIPSPSAEAPPEVEPAKSNGQGPVESETRGKEEPPSQEATLAQRGGHASDSESDAGAPRIVTREVAPISARKGYWGSRAPSPVSAMAAREDLAPRPKSRAAASAKYNNLSYWRARRVTFFKNGDPFFPGVEFRFKPGRDIGSLEALLDKLSLRMDLPRGARYLFSMDGERKLRLDELEDGGSYVCSSYKTFKVRL